MAITIGEISRFPNQALQTTFPRLQAHHTLNTVVLFTGDAQGIYVMEDSGGHAPGALYAGSDSANDAAVWVPCIVRMGDGSI